MGGRASAGGLLNVTIAAEQERAGANLLDPEDQSVCQILSWITS